MNGSIKNWFPPENQGRHFTEPAFVEPLLQLKQRSGRNDASIKASASVSQPEAAAMMNASSPIFIDRRPKTASIEAVSTLPIFVGRRTAAEYLGCWTYSVEKHIGPPDILIRVGVRDDPAWLQARLDHLINFADSPAGTLYLRNEAYKRAGITIRVADRLLNKPVAFLASGYGRKNLPLFCERQIAEIRTGIASGSIRIQKRSLKAPKNNAYVCDARHYLASDLQTERARVNQLQSTPKFWATNV